MGLPITARCDTVWIQTSDCSDTSSIEMHCLRPLLHSDSTAQCTIIIYWEHQIQVNFIGEREKKGDRVFLSSVLCNDNDIIDMNNAMSGWPSLIQYSIQQ